jgi:hypothetical protein
MSNKKENIKRPDIKGEMDEFQRLSQDLNRDEGIDISVQEIVDAFEKSNEETLSDDVWKKLENTESNEIEKGDLESVMDIAKTYNKTNPKKLVKVLESDEYERPLILNMGDRYILVAGNTRLSTAAAMGMKPKVFIGKIKKMNESNKLKGGLSDNMSLGDIAVKHKVDIDILTKDYIKGVKVEMEHTKDKNLAKEIAMDHLAEDPKYYTKLKKIETKEQTTASSSGSFEGRAFGPMIKKKDLYKPKNFKKYNVNEEEDVLEVTDASSSGAYDAPFGDGGKNPLKIGGEKSIKKSRAVKDKKFPKWGGPDSVFIKIKEKCKKFPYCNQDSNAIELLEIEDDIREISEKYGIPYKEMEKIVLNEINKIFIHMNLSDLNNLIESIASEEVKNTILTESEENKKEVYQIKLDGEPLESFNSKEEAEEALPKYQAKEKGELIIEPEIYESYTDMIEKLDQMGQELEEKENQNMENQEPMEGNEFTAALAKAKDAGEETFTVDGKEYDVQESWKQLEEEESIGMLDEEEECNECGGTSMEEELKGNQDKIDANNNGEIDADDFEKLRDMKEEKGMCNECGNMLNEEGMCSECGGMKESTKKKKTIRFTESQMVDMIKKIVSESIPGLEVTKKAQTQSKKDNESNAKEVEAKIKKATTIEGSSNPEFPEQNNGKEKVAIHNTEEENEYVEDLRGGTPIDLDYDHEPTKEFNERMKSSLEGGSKTGNSQDAANVVKSDLGKKLAKQAERKDKKEKEFPMYKKDPAPVKNVNETKENVSSVLKEEIEKMKKIASYNQKTQ